MGSFPKLGVPFWGPHSKDYSILEFILGSPYLGKLPIIANDGESSGKRHWNTKLKVVLFRD